MAASRLLLLMWTCCLLPDVDICFNFNTKHLKIFSGSQETQFGYTVQQHQAGGRQWLLVGAPLEYTGKQQTGDVFRCPLDQGNSTDCSPLNLGRVSLENVSEKKDGMRLGITLSSVPQDSSFVTCGPLWSHECGSFLYSNGICIRVEQNFQMSDTIAPAFQRCETFMDLVIVVDGSNSIYPWSDVRDFVTNILNKFNISPQQTQVGVVQYGSKVVHEFRLGEYQTSDEVLEAARSIQQRGGEETRTALAIDVARSQAFQSGGRPGAHKVMIVITDGESHDSPQLVDAVTASERDNITMYAIAVLGYYNRRGINPEAFLNEIKFIASDPDESHFFNVTDEAALKDIVDALGERIFSLEGTSSLGQGFGLQMAQAGFSSHVVEDGILLGAVGAYNWNGAVLKQAKQQKVVPPKSAYDNEFPEELQNHGAYLGYSLGSLLSSGGSQVFVAGAPRFNHSGKVITFTLDNNGNMTILQALLGEQIGSYFGSVLLTMDVDRDGQSDILLVAAPMYCSHGWEGGKVYIYTATPQAPLVLQGVLLSDVADNSRLGSALAQISDMNADGFNELAVGAPLEDDHQGVVYIYSGHKRSIRRQYKQRLSAASLSAGLNYFGRSIHAVLDANADGLVDLAVGALGAAVVIWSQEVVRLQATLTFEPEKVNVFNKDCWRGNKLVTCMSAIVCLHLHSTTASGMNSTPEVALWFTLTLNENRFPPRALLDPVDRHQPKTLLLRTGSSQCQRLGFTVQDTMDYGRPIPVTLEAGLWNSDEGPVLDPDSPNTLKTELPFWNGCAQEDACVPDLSIRSLTDLMDSKQFCRSKEGASWSLCNQHGTMKGPVFVVESRRRSVLLSAQMQNRGENAYKTSIHISFSDNLVFSSLIVKDQSDIQIECITRDPQANQRQCNINAPFMKSSSQVSFRVEFDFSPSVFLDHLRIVVATSSEGEDAFPQNNDNDIILPLKYQTDLLFTTDQSPVRFEVQSSQDEDNFPTFNMSFYIQNLAWFPVRNILFTADIWAMSLQGNRMLSISECSVEQATASCILPPATVANQVTAENLSHLPQMNQSNSVSMAVQCRLDIPASKQAKVTLTGRLHRPVLQAVIFKSLEVVVSASIHLEPSASYFLHEEQPVRQMIMELRKNQDDVAIPARLVLGSSVGGLLLLALVVLALWKLGFFNRSRWSQQEWEEPAANRKQAEGL
ncbi:integrin alpha-11 isoform X2 [Dunckerocampus dactyliophorus]|uniref:integrin alpha-11 isoform X2 n=1 Tax=Dunckerocampus dactyliophorus TaxID=161453 RepID=UPI0024062804|nr:integrin alpha-11 isoform X2 [Dunckerocampus dactyliophorus]